MSAKKPSAKVGRNRKGARGSPDRETKDRRWAAQKLTQLKPFQCWLAESPRTARDIEYYHLIKYELERLAGIGSQQRTGD